jgi:hypothetical protein
VPADGRPGDLAADAHDSRVGPAQWPWRLSVPLLVLVIAVAMLIGSGSINGRDAFYPRVLAAAVTAFALYAVVRDVRGILAERHATAGSATGPAPDDGVDPDSGVEGRGGVGVAAVRVVAFCAVAAVSVWLLDWVGYYLASAVLLAGGVLVLGVRSPVKVVAYTAALIAVAYLLFGLVLGVPLPRPLWS